MKESFIRKETEGYNFVSESKHQIQLRTFSTAQNATVFLSHKHDEVDIVKRIKYLLEKLDSKVYIDWLDPSMPEVTSGDTAIELREKIEKCDKFILIATDAATESFWCNWELGIGDTLKYEKKKIAIIPVEPDSGDWKGKEYLNIYPEIVYRDGTEKYRNGKPILKGYYYREKNLEGGFTLISLGDWLNK